jgi:prepilin-type N-terminal cleavage/methylation domain-containing protein
MCLLSNRNSATNSPEVGFSLVEIICVLVILGMIGTVFFRGYVNSVKTHINADENYQQIQKNQSGLLRVILEMQNSTGVNIEDGIIRYKYDGKDRTISKVGTNLILHKDLDSSDHILVDNLTYFLASLVQKKLSITFKTKFSDSTEKSFSTSVYISG